MKQPAQALENFRQVLLGCGNGYIKN